MVCRLLCRRDGLSLDTSHLGKKCSLDMVVRGCVDVGVLRVLFSLWFVAMLWLPALLLWTCSERAKMDTIVRRYSNASLQMDDRLSADFDEADDVIDSVSAGAGAGAGTSAGPGRGGGKRSSAVFPIQHLTTVNR